MEDDDQLALGTERELPPMSINEVFDSFARVNQELKGISKRAKSKRKELEELRGRIMKHMEESDLDVARVERHKLVFSLRDKECNIKPAEDVIAERLVSYFNGDKQAAQHLFENVLNLKDKETRLKLNVKVEKDGEGGKKKKAKKPKAADVFKRQ